MLVPQRYGAEDLDLTKVTLTVYCQYLMVIYSSVQLDASPK